ncbi:hypothetical protein HDU77_005686 [Chytriomyces hyalinus]|nr:hypothetical protein HDU77_005686 [Chytriomyces hyalinus]
MTSIQIQVLNTGRTKAIKGNLRMPRGFHLDSDNDYHNGCLYLIRHMLDYCPDSQITIDEPHWKEAREALDKREAELGKKEAVLKDARHHHLVQSGAVQKMTCLATGQSSPATAVEVKMTAQGLYEWLHGSPANSSTDLADSQVTNQEEINASSPFVFPLVGRDKSLKHIASCFTRTHAN